MSQIPVEVDVEDDAQNLEVKKEVVNHCPFGCQDDDLVENGYCKHLVGFTNDRKIMDVLTPIMVEGIDGQPEPSGRYRVLGRKKQTKPVPKDAKLVNPQRKQFFNGIYRLANLWVSWRVYVPQTKG